MDAVEKNPNRSSTTQYQMHCRSGFCYYVKCFNNSIYKLLLADVVENFRKVCKTNYGLDPMWYYTAPGLAWGAALKLTGVELDLLSDQDNYLFIEKGIRGGISTITKRYAKADNKYIRPPKDLTGLERFKKWIVKRFPVYQP
ncbi:Hypothetical predicted protein [Paramuricea clavata]|uniref:Uncharacterized protein n=1 Tax=Paramuricea clavata TaxID=317549 RepID=A0A7D9EQB4_PARCT|nr:Hypothetical predicted protein [Paramuricea clavata]